MMDRRNFLRLAGAGLGSGVIRAQPPGGVDVKTFGAKGDGKSLDTSAINKAIDAAAAAGGGAVYFPSGAYLSYSIHLKSNVSLYLSEGASIVAADSTVQSGLRLRCGRAEPVRQVSGLRPQPFPQ